MRRAELRRFPLMTAVVAGVTGAGAVAQAAIPGLLGALQRTPAGLHGEWWRSVTALVVQDGGMVGAVSNLLFLVLVGAAAEQVLSRPRWLLQYAGTGVAAEFVAYAWQPVGAGNSIAICGLAGGVAVALWRGDRRPPGWTVPVLLVWCGALLATLAPAALVPGIVAGGLGAALASAARQRGVAVARPAALAVLVTGIGLATAANIHGAALLIGLALALAGRATMFKPRGHTAAEDRLPGTTEGRRAR